MSRIKILIVATILMAMAATAIVAGRAGEPAAIGGKWKLEADAQGQAVDLILILDQKEAAFTGTVSTPYGDGAVENGKLTENNFEAAISIEIQGQPMDLSLTGKVDGEKMTGSITGDGIPVVTFTGSKEKPKEDTQTR